MDALRVPMAAHFLTAHLGCVACLPFMSFHRRFIASVVAGLALIVCPLFAQEAVESSPSPQSVEPPALEQAKPEEKPRPKAKEKQEKPVRDLQDSMTAEQFKAAGLDKLSPEELKNLNASLRGERRAAETRAAEKATAVATEKAVKSARARVDELEGSLQGPFNGLTGRTIITLEDGTVWKQANSEDHFRAAVPEHTGVLVSRGSFGWKMQIKGSRSFYVDPVRK
jgi:hypothetical protein